MKTESTDITVAVPSHLPTVEKLRLAIQMWRESGETLPPGQEPCITVPIEHIEELIAIIDGRSGQ